MIINRVRKNRKKKLGTVVSTEAFIKTGLNVLKKLNTEKNQYKKELDIYDFLEVIQIKYILDNLYGQKIKKNIIIKDATASGYQHLIKILGYNSEYALKACNLDDENHWYDTYSIIIEQFKLNLAEPLLKNYWKYIYRKSVKFTIMTDNYSSSFRTCFENFKSHVNWEEKTWDEKENLKKIFTHFFSYLKNNNKHCFFKNKTSHLYDINENNRFKVSLNDGRADISYYMTTIKSFDIKINSKRYTTQILFLTENIDKRKIRTASKTNITHSAEGEVTRRAYREWEHSLLTIHDCFLIDILEVDNFIERMNIIMNKSSFKDKELHNINKNLYSFYIVI